MYSQPSAHTSGRKMQCQSVEHSPESLLLTLLVDSIILFHRPCSRLYTSHCTLFYPSPHSQVIEGQGSRPELLHKLDMLKEGSAMTIEKFKNQQLKLKERSLFPTRPPPT